ncbi:MAG: MFS transporter [Antricoccus sp.]
MSNQPIVAADTQTERRSALLLLGCMLIVALNLRPLISSVPPLLTTIERDLGISSAIAGLVTTMAVICMAVFAPIAAVLSRRFSAEALIMISLLMVCLGSALRLLANGSGILFIATFIGGAGLATCGALLPGVVRRDFPGRAGFATGMYTVGLTAGAAIASALTVPLANWLGSWQRSLASWALLAVVGVVAWIGPFRQRVAPHPDNAPPKLPWRLPRAWLLTAWLVTASTSFYTCLTWLAPYYQALGYSDERSGYLLGVFSAGQIVASMLLPSLADRRTDRRLWMFVAALATVIGLIFTVWWPLAMPWVSVSVMAFGAGGTFALGLTYLVDYAQSQGGSSSLSGMCFLMSYTAAAITPPLVGAINDATGSLQLGFGVMLALAVIGVALSYYMRPASHWTARPAVVSAARSDLAQPNNSPAAS